MSAGTVRADVGVGAVMTALHGICAAYDHVDAEGLITLVIDGLRPAHTK